MDHGRLAVKLAIPIMLLLAASSARAQGFPNTYTGTATVSYDPAHGAIDPARGVTPGTVTVTVTFRGATQGTTMNQSGIQHHPYPFVKLGPTGGSMTNQGYIGPGFLPNTDMGGWNHVFTFDLQNSGCDFAVLENGGCELDNEPSVQCPIHGYFAIPWTKVQFEIANTTSNLNPSTRYWNGTTHVYKPTAACINRPDFPGPDFAFGNEPFGSTIDTFSATYIRTQDFGWRFAIWGQDFFGDFEWFNLPRPENSFPYLDMAIVHGPCTCTRKDAPSATPTFNQCS